MRTNVPDIFSAGDVTSFPLTIRGDQRVNIGHWQMSQAQGKTLIQRNAAQYCVCWLHVADHHFFDLLQSIGVVGENNLMPKLNVIMLDSYFYFLFYFTSGRVAALNMLKKPTKLESVPFFWTVLLGKSIRYTGRVLPEKMSALRQNITASFNVISSCRFPCFRLWGRIHRNNI